MFTNNTVRICFLSDSHDQHHDIPPIEPCFALIHTGDAISKGQYTNMVEFLNWFAKQPACYKIFVAGNHDAKQFNQDTPRMKQHCAERGIITLVDEYFEIPKPYIKFYGAPLLKKNREYPELPERVDILLTHEPPFGIMDKVDRAPKPHEDPSGHLGTKHLHQCIPHIHAFGHIHEGRGIVSHAGSGGNHTSYINSCMVDRGDLVEGMRNYLLNRPIYADLPVIGGSIDWLNIKLTAPEPFRARPSSSSVS